MFLTSKYSIIFSALIMAWLLLVPAPMALAEDTTPTGVNSALGGLNNTAQTGGIKTSTTGTDLPTIIGKIIGVALAFLGVVFFILIIYGGYMWMFSMGNEQTVSKAKQVITAAVIGLVIVLMAYVITAYLGGQFTRIPST